MKATLLKEILPLTQNDCFSIFYRTKSAFDLPLHYHEEFELNFIENGKSAKRLVGDHIEEITDRELVLIGPNLQHAWYSHNCKNTDIKEITIQFNKDLFSDRFLQRNQMNMIRSLLENSSRGILFSENVTREISSKLVSLTEKNGFDSVLELFTILNILSVSKSQKLLSDISYSKSIDCYKSRRIDKIMQYINNHFEDNITLKDVSKIAGMTEVSLSRFFKMRTGQSFVDTLTEIRIGNASRMLIDTTQSINEVAYKCGFNNISNFNRIFKKKKLCTPKEFRETYDVSGFRTFI